jgi:phage baseplate assembly protein W
MTSTPRWFGINAPFIGGNEKVLSRQVDDKLIRNDLLQLLLTGPGERVMRPTFGAGLRRFLFQPITSDQLDLLRANIQTAIETFETRVIVSDIQLITTPDNNLITIRIYGRFNYNPDTTAGLLVELGQPTSKTKNIQVGQ